MSARRRLGVRGFAVVAGLLFCALPALGQTPEQIFDRGNAAYQRERFAEAAEDYRTVLRYGIRDPRVEYNLGNAEFRLGRLGPAILHYERARRLAPTDDEIQANLAFARTFCFDRVELPEQPAVLRWLYLVQDRVGPDRHALFVLALVWLLALIVVAGLARPGAWSAVHGWSLAALLLALTMTIASWSATHERLEGRRLAVVLDEVVEVVAGPGPNNPTLFTVHEGLTVEIRDVRQDWVQVSLPNALNGWLPREAVGAV